MVADTSGTEQIYRCPECGHEVEVSPKTDDIDVLLGCSKGHDVKDMAEREWLADPGGDQSDE